MDARVVVGRKRITAALATGMIVSITALVAGVSPALAEPGGGGSGPTTTVVVPEPKAEPKAEPAEQAEQAPAREAPAAEPAAPKQAEAPAVTQAPVAEAPAVEAPPVSQAPAAAEPEPRTQAPRPQTQAPKPAPAAPPASSTTATKAPAPSATPSPATTAAERPAPSESSAPQSNAPDAAAPEGRTPRTEAPQSTTPESRAPEAGVPPTDSTSPSESAAPSDGSAPTTQPAEPSDPSTSETAGPGEGRTSGTETADPDEQTATSSVSQAARAIETAEPETLVAPVEDVAVAKTAKVVELPDPAPAPKEEIDQIARLIDLPNVPRDLPGLDRARDEDRTYDVRRAGAWDRNVRQWSPDWVEYDDYYRPVLSNPYRDPVRIVYVYENRPRIAYIPPLSRIVLEVAQYAAYSFTAIVESAVSTVVNTALNVAVGSFFGGGFFPGIGLPFPPPPPPLLRYDNVPVFVNYQRAQYEPFRVQRIVDVGNDARFGERKVLLDGVTPAWGEWTQTPAGERQFEVHRTQQFPGLDQPSEAPLPGDYQLRLLSDESPSAGLNRRDVYLMTAAGLCAILSVGAVLVAMAMGRRRNA